MKKYSKLRYFSHILILTLVLVIAVGATFSWYNRTVITSAGEGNKFTYIQNGNVNGVGGSITTYKGTNVDGVVTYSNDPLTSTGGLTTEPGALNYFKTVITDESTEGDSMISVYLENFTYSKSMGNSIHIGISEPEKTYKKYTSTLSGSNYVAKSICLEDNVFVKKGGTVEIYWFVEIDANYSGNGSLSLGTMHLVYN